MLLRRVHLLSHSSRHPRGNPTVQGGEEARLGLCYHLATNVGAITKPSTPVLDKQYGVAGARHRGLRKTAHANDFAVGSHRGMPGGSLLRTTASKRPRDAGRGFVRSFESSSLQGGVHYSAPFPPTSRAVFIRISFCARRSFARRHLAPRFFAGGFAFLSARAVTTISASPGRSHHRA